MKAGDATEAKDVQAKLGKLKMRMLEGHEPSRRRYLSESSKSVTMKYDSKRTPIGDSKGLVGGPQKKTESSSNAGAAVAGGVVVVGTLATVGYLFYAKKACFAAKTAAGNVPTNAPTGTNANMQPAQV